MRKLLKVFGVIVFVASISLWLAYRYYWEGVDTSNRKPAFTISPETTFVTGPLDSQGFVDYETALNELLRKDTKPEENAVVLLWKVLGPKPEGYEVNDRYFQKLGVPKPAETPDDFVSFVKFSQGKSAFGQGTTEFDQEMDAVTKRPWLAKDHPLYAEWLEKNAAAMVIAEQASRCTKYFHPLVIPRRDQNAGTLLDALLPILGKTREVAAAFARRAMLKTAEGKHDEAWADLLTVHRLARLHTQGGTLIEMLVGYALELVALDSDLAFLEHAQLSADKIRTLMDDLQRLPAPSAIGDRGGLTDRITHLDIVQQSYRNGFGVLESLSNNKEPPKPSRAKLAAIDDWDWDLIFQISNDWFDRFEQAGRIQDLAERKLAFEELSEELLNLPVTAGNILEQIAEAQIHGSARISRSTKFANNLVRLLLPALHKIYNANDRREQRMQNFRVACALAAYKADNSKYPATLDALQPKYLPTIPLDLFSGEPLIYQPDDKGYLLYSVGENGQDDNGMSFDDIPRGDDLVIRMPLPPLKK